MWNRSCLSQLLLSYSKLCDALDGNSSCDIIFTDFSNSVLHQELLYKLWISGITGPLWLWFRDYLSGRCHFVSFKGESSVVLPVLSGVPQGSILGPLLFFCMSMTFRVCAYFHLHSPLLMTLNFFVLFVLSWMWTFYNEIWIVLVTGVLNGS